MALDNDKNRKSGRKFEEIHDNENVKASVTASRSADAGGPDAVVVGDPGPPLATSPDPSGSTAAARSAFPAKAGSASDSEAPLDKLSIAELIELRGKIDRLLPPRTLADVNLEEALLEQYHVANELMTTTLSGGEEANKKAQTVNTCTAILQSVVKMQSELYNAERVKALELAIDRAFKETMPEKKKDFFEAYARAIDEVRAQYMTKAQRRDQGT